MMADEPMITGIIPIFPYCKAAKAVKPMTRPNQLNVPVSGNNTFMPNQTARFNTTPTTEAVMAESVAESFLFPLVFSI